MMTKEGGKKMVQTMIAKHGSYEAWRAHMKKIAAKGGKNGRTGGFYVNRELARIVGAKGGNNRWRKEK